MGFDKLEEMVKKWKGIKTSRYTLKVFAGKETYEAMAKLAVAQGMDASELSAEIIQNYAREAQNKGTSIKQ
jgi:hypothetical protein